MHNLDSQVELFGSLLAAILTPICNLRSHFWFYIGFAKVLPLAYIYRAWVFAGSVSGLASGYNFAEKRTV